MSIESSKDNYLWLYFVQTSKNLPDFYYDLSDLFNHFGISLIPTTPSMLLELSQNQKSNVLAIERSLQDRRVINMILKKHLGFGVKTGNATLFHASSFSVNKEFQKYNHYHSFSLPLILEFLVTEVAKEVLFNGHDEMRKWPGRRRGFLLEKAV